MAEAALMEPDMELRIAGEEIVCDWGVITNPDGDPRIGFQYLMVVGMDWLKSILRDGPKTDKYGSLCSAEALTSGIFFYAERDGSRWAWKLHQCHWWDSPEINDAFLIGRWMD
jgi:hypothetical protein